MAQILIVDDDEDIRATVRFLLEDEGYTVAEAANGAIAHALLTADNDIRVVLLDHLMPELDGIALLHQIAAEPSLVDRYGFILLTASQATVKSAPQTVPPGLRVLVVSKPFNVTDLLDAITALQTSPPPAPPLQEAADA